MVVVTNQAPDVLARSHKFGDRTVFREHFESPGGRRLQAVSEQAVDGSSVASDDDGLAPIVTLKFLKCGDDTVMKLSERLASWEHNGMRIAVEVRATVTSDEVVEGHSIAIGARVVFAEAFTNLQLVVTNQRREYLSGLACTWVSRRDDGINDEFVGARQALTEGLGLQLAVVGEAST